MDDEQNRDPLCLGVTGSMGSGKSEVCRILNRLGARIFDSDVIAKELMTESPELKLMIMQSFGNDCYFKTGELNKQVISSRIFSTKETVERMNKLVHPMVKIAFEKEKIIAAMEGIRILVMEAALLYESGADKHLDKVWVVHCEEAKRIARIQKRNGWSLEQIKERTKYQLDPEILKAKADLVIENNGSTEDLEQLVRELWKGLPA